MELLMRYLEEPDAERLFNVHARAYSLSLLEPTNFSNSIIFANWNQSVSEIQEALGLDDVNFVFGQTMYGKWLPRSSNSHMTVYSGVTTEEMQKKNKASISVYSVLDDRDEARTEKYEAEWNGFWQYSNMMQFIESFSAVSIVGLHQMVYSAIPAKGSIAGSEEVTIPSSNVWNDTLEQLFDNDVKVFASKCIDLGIPAPSSVGFELINTSSAVIGEAELVWEIQKIALLTPEQMDNKEVFIAEGWTVLTLGDGVQKTIFEGVKS
jgi:DEAD/DEAH box helicase domain-containing protein